MASDANLRKFRYGNGTMADTATAHAPLLHELDRMANANDNLRVADFEFVRQIGAGSFSSVERLFAMKRIVASTPCEMPAFHV